MKRLFLLSAVLVSSLAYAGKDLDREAIQLSVAAGNIPQQRQQIEAKLTQVHFGFCWSRVARAPNPIVLPRASRIGNMIRLRKRS